MKINPAISTIPLNSSLYSEKKLEVDVARLDLLHPVVSGNKYFKLKHNIEKALNENASGIITFGGAYSNHLAATAFACREAKLKSIAVVRGEEAPSLSHTLIFCKEMGMQLQFVSRDDYSNKEKLYHLYQKNYPDFYLVPEGGDNEAGEKGCTEILNTISNATQYTHIICAIGTGTTFKGIAKSAEPNQKIMGIVVLKGAEEMNNHLSSGNALLIHDG
jgi:1-aminocyclopropane-1-carboxylate deaminase